MYTTRSKTRSNTIIHPRLRPLPFKDFQIDSTPSPPELKPIATINGTQFFQCEDIPLNKRGFKYKACLGAPEFTSNVYSTTEYPPYAVRASYFDRSAGIIFDRDVQSVSTAQGWRSVRANTAIREGTWYFEFEIAKANESGQNCHVRVGLGRREASLEAPVGFDGYGYGLRDVNGEHMSLSRPQGVYVPGGFSSGDVVGIKVELPSLESHRAFIGQWKANEADKRPSKKSRKKKEAAAVPDEQFRRYDNVVRDQVPIKYKNALYFEQYDYTTQKIMDHLLNPVAIFGEKAVLEEAESGDLVPRIPDSSITIYKNGVECDAKISGLFSFLDPTMVQSQNPNYRGTDDGSLGYYPMMSVFGGGVVRLNPGPHFHYNNTARPLSELYDEQVVEEWWWDMVDEVEGAFLDELEKAEAEAVVEV